jgi:hypothetical protein
MSFLLRRALCLSALSATLLAAGQTTDLAHKKAALQQACASGVLTLDECKQRLAALNAPAGAPPAAGGQIYHDPNGRFTMTIPAGWTIDTSAGNLKITNGDAWANFNTEYQTGGPLAVVQAEAQKMEQFLTDPKVLNQGSFTTAAQYPAAGITLGCTVSAKSGPTHRVMLFNVIAAGNDNYVVMTSSADYDTGRPLNAALAQAIDSVRF